MQERLINLSLDIECTSSSQTQNSHSIIKPQQNASSINPFYATDLFWYPLKTLENQRFSDVFWGYQKISEAWNELTEKQNLIKRWIFYLLRSYLVKFVFLSARERWFLSSQWCCRHDVGVCHVCPLFLLRHITLLMVLTQKLLYHFMYPLNVTYHIFRLS